MGDSKNTKTKIKDTVSNMKLRKLSMFPDLALKSWGTLHASDQAEILYRMRKMYGHNFVTEFKRYASGAQSRGRTSWTEIQYDDLSSNALMNRGYRKVRRVGSKYDSEYWVHPSGDEMVRMLPIQPKPAPPALQSSSNSGVNISGDPTRFMGPESLTTVDNILHILRAGVWIKYLSQYGPKIAYGNFNLSGGRKGYAGFLLAVIAGVRSGIKAGKQRNLQLMQKNAIAKIPKLIRLKIIHEISLLLVTSKLNRQEKAYWKMMINRFNI